MKLLFPLLLLSFATSAAWAEVPEVKLVTISDFKYEGNGCPKGSVSTYGSTLHGRELDDGMGSIDLSYRLLGILPKVNGVGGLRNAVCAIKMSLTFEPGYKFQVHDIIRDVHKDLRLPKEVTLDTTYALGNSQGVSMSANFSGVGFDARSTHSDLSDNQEFYSDCSGQVDLSIQSNVKVVSEAKREDDEIDDISMAFIDMDILEFSLRRCE